MPAGAVRNTVTGTIDLLPTFASLADARIPANVTIDGVDISKLLLGQTTTSSRKAQFYYLEWQLQAVRVGPWKLALQPQGLSMQVMEGGVKTVGLRLYNLDDDIGETQDVAAQHLDLVKRLQTLAEQQRKAFCNDSSTGPGVRPPGWVAKPEYLVTVPPDYRPPKWMKDNYRRLFPKSPGE